MTRLLFLAVLSVCCLSACGVGPFPGGKLDGPERPLATLDTAALDPISVVVLETRREAPYSVHVQLFKVDGGLYLDPAPERRWLKFMEADPQVRIQFTGDAAVYRARAIREEDPAILGQFDAQAVILRLVSD